MKRAIQKIKDATPEISALLTREHGKPLYDSEGEIMVSLMWMEFACDNAKEVLSNQVQEHENDERAMRRLVISNFLTAGQICMIAKRIYVDRSIYAQFVEKYIEAANKWIRVRDPFNKDVTIGAVNNKKQVEYVQSLIDDAESKGAKVIKLGKVSDKDLFNKGYFLQPTVVLGADYKDPIAVEEQFGPTVPILPFDDDNHANFLANDSIYGLTSSVWGEEEHAIEVAKHIQAGTTMINTAAVQGLDVRFPFGDVKQSGIGREYGKEGLLIYTDTHVINIPKNRDLPYIPE